MSKYGAILDEEASQPPSTASTQRSPSRYGAILDEEDSISQNAVFRGTQKNPADTLEATRLSGKLGVPAPVVETDLPRYRQEEKRADWQTMLTAHPELKTFLQNEHYVSRLNDDASHALDLGKLLQEKGFKQASVEKRKRDEAEVEDAAVREIVRSTQLDYKQASGMLVSLRGLASSLREKGIKESEVNRAVFSHMQRFGNATASATTTAQQFAQDSPNLSALLSGVAKFTSGAYGVARAAQEAVDPVLRPYGLETSQVFDAGAMSSYLSDIGSRFETAMMQQGFVEARDKGKAVEWLGTQVLANAPSTALSLGGMLRPDMAHQVLTVLAGASGGGQYQQLREQGYDQSLALTASLAYGWLEQAFERQPIDVANNLRQQWAALSPEARADFSNRLVQGFLTSAAMVGTNAAEEYGTQLSQNLVDILSAGLQEAVGGETAYTDAERSKSVFEGGFDAFMSGAASGGVHAPFVVASQMRLSDEDAARMVLSRELQSALVAQHNADMLEEIVARTNNSEALKRGDTEAYGQLLQRMTAAAGLEHVYLPAAEVLTAVDAQTAERMLPSLAGKLEEAAQNGQRVEVPVSEFVLATRDSDVGEVLRRVASTEVNGMSAAEAQTFFETQADLLQQKVDEIAAKAKDIEAARADVAGVRKLVDEQFAGVKMFTRTAQKFYADQRMAFYVTMADRAGITVQEMYDRYPLRLRADGVPTTDAENSYRQPDGSGGVEGDADGMVRFTHWSNVKGLTQLDPQRFGDGAAGAERSRRDADPENWVNRTSVAIAGGGYTREAQLGQQRYTGSLPASLLYDFNKDPLALLNKARAIAAEKAPGAVRVANLYERLIKEAGFQGYLVDHPQLGKVANLFDAARVMPTEPSDYAQRLQGAPYVVDVDGQTVEFEPFETAERVAREYMAAAGLPYNPPTIYTKVDEERAKRIAAEFEKMKHDPQDPEVAAAYAKMIEEVIAQYRAVLATGLQIEFVPAGQADPYGNPRHAMLDVTENNHLWVFPTREGFGSDPTFDVSQNPLLAETEFEISGQKALANDLFRIVHDYFGHIKDGVGFRASGEENAWRSHWAMFSPLARRAMTTETRGQNSWLNFGPEGERNRTALTQDTVFADQKIGLLPDWVANDGATDADVVNSREYAQATAPVFYSALLKGVEKIKAKALTPDGWKAELKGLVNKQAAKQAEIDASGILDWLDMHNVEVDGVVPKIPKEEMQKALELGGVQVEEVVYGGEPNSDFNLEDSIHIGQFETEEPDSYWIEENAREYYYEDELAQLKEDFADEIESGEMTEQEVEEKAMENSIQLAENSYWNDDESPQTAKVTAEADGKTFEFWIEYAYGEKRVYSYDKQDYLDGISYRSDEEDIRRAIANFIYEEGYAFQGEAADGTDGPTQYHDYSSGKGTDYRELLLTIPRRTVDEGGNYSSSHWDGVDNPIAHVRFSTRTDRDGKPVLFIEEIQSDWAQQGRDRGFAKGEIDTTGWTVERINYESTVYVDIKDAEGKSVYNYTFGKPWALVLKDGGQRYKTFNTEAEARAALVGQPELEAVRVKDSRDGTDAELIARAAERKQRDAIPSGPFVENTDAWVTLVLKRMVRWAAENGMDEVAIIGGQESADRYSLTKYISKITAERWMHTETGEDTGQVVIKGFDLNGRRVMEKTFMSPSDPGIADAVGKAQAHEIEQANGVGEWTGQNIKSGGEGMLFFYGEEDGAGVGKKPDGTPSVVAKNLTKLLKQLGGEGLKTIRLDEEKNNSYGIRQRENGDWEAWAGTETRTDFKSWDEANTWLRDESGFLYKSYLGFTITEKMRDTAMNAGLPLFQTDRRGSYSPETGVIRLTKATDLSTFLHESGHQYLDIMFDMATRADAAPDIVADMQLVLDWFGVDSFDTWASMGVDQRRPYHEKWAEGFERYLFEGKAPSNRLREAFAAFSRWLVRIYRMMQNDLSPEIRGVFDRMLASEAEIEQARETSGKSLFTSQAESGMDDETWMHYKADERERVDQAIEQHQRRRLRDMKWLDNAKGRELRRLQREAAGVRRGVRDEVERELRAEPVYAALEFIKYGRTRTVEGEEVQVDVGHKLNTDALAQMFPAGALAAIDWRTTLRGLHNVEGLHPDIIAPVFGYQSGDELVRALLNAEPFKDAVDARVERRMLEEHSELADEQAIEDSANQALHNEAHLKFLATEHAALANLAGAQKVPLAAVKETAAVAIGRTEVAKITPNVYVQAERRAAKAAESAMRKGDLQGALTEKRNQLINAALIRMAYEAKADVAKRIAAMRKAFGNDKKLAKTRDINLVNAARALIDAHDGGDRAVSPMAHLDKVKAYDPGLYEVLAASIAPLLSNAKPAAQMTLDEFKGFSDVVAQLWHLSRRSKQIEIDGKMVNRADAIAQLREAIAPHVKDKPRGGVDADMRTLDRLRVYYQSWGSTLRRVESWVTLMDGGPRGPFRTYLWNPVRYGVERYRSEVQVYLDKYRALLKGVDMRHGKAISAKEIGYTFTQGKVSLLHALLHTGNASNKRKLLLGRGWGTENENGEVDSTLFDAFIDRMIEEGVLTKADFDFAQGVWDLLEAMKPDAQRAHKNVYGYYFDEITANGFKNKFGEYRGGYVPAQTDSFLVADAAVNEAAENLTGEGSFMWPSTGAGFTKSRVEYNKPLTLDLRMLGAHIDKALRFTHIQPPVQDVARLLRSNGFRGAMEKVDVTVIPDMLLPWLQRAASQVIDTPPNSKFNAASGRFFKWARSTAGMTIMFANIVNTLQQLTGFSVGMLRANPVSLAKALMRVNMSPRETNTFITGSSAFMKNRNATQVMDIQSEIKKIVLDPNLAQQGAAFVRQHAYFMQAAVQNYVDNVVWLAAYYDATSRTDYNAAEQADRVEAARIADAAVRETQGSFSPEDVASIEAGTPFYRMFVMFAGYFNMLANTLTTDFKNTVRQSGLRHGYGRLLYTYLFGFAIPAWMAEGIVQAFQPAGDDGDEDENYVVDAAEALFMPQVRTALAMVPGVGMVATHALNRFDDKWYNDRLTVSPALSVGEKAFGGAHAVLSGELFDEDVKKGEVKDFMTLMAVLSGLPPVAAAAKPVGYMIDVEQGNTEPSGPVDFARGVVTGR